VAEWYRVDTPGTYSFSVNPATHLMMGPDNGITYQVYASDELSKPIAPFHGEVVTVGGWTQCVPNSTTQCWTVPSYREAKYVVQWGSPLYIKVFHRSKDYPVGYTGNYRFLYHRSDCASMDQACEMNPYAWTPYEWPAGVSAALYGFHVDRPDFGHQTLTVSLTEEAGTPPDAISSAEIITPEGVTVNANGMPMRLTRVVNSQSGLAEWAVTDTSGALESFGGPLNSWKFFLKVTRNPAFSGALKTYGRWTTNLTWLYGPALGGAPGDILCEESSENGDDEIWIEARDTSSGIPFGEDTGGYDLNGHFDEDESVEWTNGFLGQRPRKAFVFTQSVTVRLWEDDDGPDDPADRPFDALGEVSTPQRAPTYYWNLDGGTYKGRGPTLSHYMDARLCQQNTDCEQPVLYCGGGVCRHR
jgi:hypothetical protein